MEGRRKDGAWKSLPDWCCELFQSPWAWQVLAYPCSHRSMFVGVLKPAPPFTGNHACLNAGRYISFHLSTYNSFCSFYTFSIFFMLRPPQPSRCSGGSLLLLGQSTTSSCPLIWQTQSLGQFHCGHLVCHKPSLCTIPTWIFLPLSVRQTIHSPSQTAGDRHVVWVVPWKFLSPGSKWSRPSYPSLQC